MVLFDIETVPIDENVLSPAMRYLIENDTRFNGVSGRLKDPAKIAAAKDDIDVIKKSIKQRSLNPDFGKIVAIVCFTNVFTDHKTGEPVSKEDVVVEKLYGDEKGILKGFWDIIEEWGSQTITFNGFSFDIPFVQKRSMYNGIVPTRDISGRKYSTKISFDVAQVLSNWMAPNNLLKLEQYLELLGIPVNPNKLSGDKVYDLYKDGKIIEIVDYCYEDCSDLYNLFDVVVKYYPYLLTRDRLGNSVY